MKPTIDLEKLDQISKEFGRVLLLTNLEHDILLQVGHGRATKEIKSLGNIISKKTAECHKAHIREKLGVVDFTALINFASRYVMYMELTGTTREFLPETKIKYQFVRK